MTEPWQVWQQIVFAFFWVIGCFVLIWQLSGRKEKDLWDYIRTENGQGWFVAFLGVFFTIAVLCHAASGLMNLDEIKGRYINPAVDIPALQTEAVATAFASVRQTTVARRTTWTPTPSDKILLKDTPRAPTPTSDELE